MDKYFLSSEDISPEIPARQLSAQGVVDHIARFIETWTNGEPYRDDITMVALKVN